MFGWERKREAGAMLRSICVSDNTILFFFFAKNGMPTKGCLPIFFLELATSWFIKKKKKKGKNTSEHNAQA